MMSFKNPATALTTVSFCLLTLVGCLVPNTAGADPLVRLRTGFGDIFLDLRPGVAPLTVANFLTYVNSSAFDSSFFHRNLPGFVLQGGDAVWLSGANNPAGIPENAPVVNEFNLSNTRGTVSMAKRENLPDSATNNFFINLADNSSNLDFQNEGFTVFATVNAAGMEVVDSISALRSGGISGLSNDVPTTAPVGAAVTRNSVVLISSAEEFAAIAAPVSAILPSSRSVAVGTPATGFATILNSTANPAASCSMTPMGAVAADFVYRQTNPATNEAFGINNPLLDIPAGGSVSLVFSFTPNAAIASAPISFDYTCGNSNGAAALTPGVNTFELGASVTAPADVVALAGTTSGDGINNIPNSVGSGAFVVATVNLGAEETITVAADTGGVSLPLGLFVCATDAATGACIDPAGASTSVTMGTNDTGTFAVFAQLVDAADTVAFDPAGNRAFVRFVNASGELRGSTSVALRTVE